MKADMADRLEFTDCLGDHIDRLVDISAILISSAWSEDACHSSAQACKFFGHLLNQEAQELRSCAQKAGYPIEDAAAGGPVAVFGESDYENGNVGIAQKADSEATAAA